MEIVVLAQTDDFIATASQFLPPMFPSLLSALKARDFRGGSPTLQFSFGFQHVKCGEGAIAVNKVCVATAESSSLRGTPVSFHILHRTAFVFFFSPGRDIAAASESCHSGRKSSVFVPVHILRRRAQFGAPKWRNYAQMEYG